MIKENREKQLPQNGIELTRDKRKAIRVNCASG